MIWNIAKAELQMLFYSPVAWLLLIVFSVQASTIFAGKLESFATTQEMGYTLQGMTFVITYVMLYLAILATEISPNTKLSRQEKLFED